MDRCKINWKSGKDVTVTQIKKKQRHKATGQLRTTIKTEPCDSFFNFFTPPRIPHDEDTEEIDEEVCNGCGCVCVFSFFGRVVTVGVGTECNQHGYRGWRVTQGADHP